MSIRKHTHLLLLGGLLASSVFTACGEDRWAEYYPLTGRDLWIDSVMRAEYLWREDIPSFNELNYFVDPEEFLKDACSPQDKGFSSIDTIYDTPPTGYGMDYTLYRMDNNDTAYTALITYVMPQSPASDAGLQRGEWIMMIDDSVFLTQKNEALLTEGTGPLHLTIGKYTVMQTEDGEDVGAVVADHTTLLPQARPVNDAAIPVSSIIEMDNTVCVGYLACNSFQPDTDETLRSLSRNFADAGISDLVIDLRYNQGGLMESAQLLATLLVPQNELGSLMASLHYHPDNASKNRSLTFDADLLQTGNNLNMNRIFVLTSNETAAASEMFINCLKPYMDVILIGETTQGHYVGTESFTTARYPWELKLAVCEVFNANGTADYTSGFTPDYQVDALSDPFRILPLGNPDEALLYTALSVINGSLTEETYPSSQTANNILLTPNAKKFALQRNLYKGLNVRP